MPIHSDIFGTGMSLHRIFVIILLALLVRTAFGQSDNTVVKNLREEWMVLDHSLYRKFEGDAVKAIYFSLDANSWNGDFFRVADDEPFAVFINQKLVTEKDRGPVTFRVDSLSAVYSTPMVIGIFQRRGISSLSTTLLSSAPAVPTFDQTLFPRKVNFFLNFALITALLVSMHLAFLMGTNPRLTFDYLNASKLFSVQEREGNLLASRVTSRVNLVFYLFCSLFCSITLLVVFHLTGDLVPLAHHFPIRSTWEGFFQWIKLSVIIAALLIGKMVLVFVLSDLFKVKDAAAIQYFHFIRALILAAGLITVISVVNFIFKGPVGGLHFILLKTGAGVLVLSAFMMYLKLLGLTRYHFFHLFSYLCASEIIPLVILLKVLLY
jgi:hypothetical protein